MKAVKIILEKKKRPMIWIICCLFLGNLAFTQEASFTVEVYPESLLMGNQLEVQFKLENAEGQNFQPPSFEGFHIVSGPNQSSTFSMINGAVTRSLTYTYYLEPKEVGNYYIEPASMDTGETTMTTLPKEIIVEPNPDGIQQTPKANQRSRTFDFFKMPDMPDSTPKTKPKKKRKIYRIAP